MFKKVGLGVVASLAVAFTGVSAQASDGSFIYSDDNPKGGGVVKNMDYFEMTYSSIGGTEKFSTTYDFKPEVAKLPNGFWLVVSDGENPKTNANEYAILYGDLATGTVTAYVYSGKNNSGSWTNTDGFIESVSNAITVDEQEFTVSIDLDVTNINAFVPNNGMMNDWDGVAFDEKAGIWFHPADFSNVVYDKDGRIAGGKITNAGWYDKANLKATRVSEPATLALLGLGLTGLGMSRRRRAIAA